MGAAMSQWRSAVDTRQLRTDDWLFDSLEAGLAPDETVRLGLRFAV
jgi:hypothetical protein